MARLKLNEGHLSFDGSTVTLEFTGILTQTVKKQSSPRMIPVSDILDVEVSDGGRMTPGYVRFHRASTARNEDFKAAFDCDTMTFLQAKRPPELDVVINEIRRRLASAPPLPPSANPSTPPPSAPPPTSRPAPISTNAPGSPSEATEPVPSAPTEAPPRSATGTEPVEGTADERPGRGGLFKTKRRQEAEAELDRLREIVERAGGAEAPGLAREIARLRSELAEVSRQLTSTRQELAKAQTDVIETREAALLQEVGIYEFRHRLEDAAAYKGRLAVLSDQFKTLARNGGAVVGATTWQVNGSAAQGRKMVKDFSKLMLRAYNNEADNLVRTMKPYKLESALSRLSKSRETIAKLGKTMSIEVTDEYHRLRTAELELTADYLAMVAEEKERAREERERLREERKAMAELKREEERLQKEANHRRSVLARLQTSGASPEELEAAQAALGEVESALQGVLDREANVRAGYVYVISNVGSFGEGIIKVGMTRRLEPMDRVHELGDASVPFKFDAHALVFSEDAVGLEADLHRALAAKRVNLVNLRREYFYASPAEIQTLMEARHGQLLQFDELPEAVEWHQSATIRRKEHGDVALPAGAVPGGVTSR
ncbi:MAG: DUF4041 domain-containing protein [Nitriliruptoraceae bacterium]|nr:DUF4041 domain-containing protein [Nitriliruptoraceae bacterium]